VLIQNGVKSNPTYCGGRPGAAFAAGGPTFLDRSILTFVVRIDLFIFYPHSDPSFFYTDTVFQTTYLPVLCICGETNVFMTQFLSYFSPFKQVCK
jgi:hypothetical protein